MQLEVITLTLSRLHKVIDRVKEAVAEKVSKIEESAGLETVSVVAPIQFNRLRAAGLNAYQAAADAEKLLLLQAQLRAKVSEVNEQTGISALLARQDAIARALKIKKGLLPSEAAISLEAAMEQAEALQAKERPVDYGLRLRVTLLPAVSLEYLQEEVRRLQAELYAIGDKVAALNSTQVEIQLSRELAEKFGLA